MPEPEDKTNESDEIEVVAHSEDDEEQPTRGCIFNGEVQL
jgi:hypothetical protein